MLQLRSLGFRAAFPSQKKPSNSRLQESSLSAAWGSPGMWPAVRTYHILRPPSTEKSFHFQIVLNSESASLQLLPWLSHLQLLQRHLSSFVYDSPSSVCRCSPCLHLPLAIHTPMAQWPSTFPRQTPSPHSNIRHLVTDSLHTRTPHYLGLLIRKEEPPKLAWSQSHCRCGSSYLCVCL